MNVAGRRLPATERARVWVFAAAIGVVSLCADLQWVHGLAWDEVEFFRATRWTAFGLLPYRDFWEHHTPLQWLVFAPLARMIGLSPGASAIIEFRWAQLVAWCGIAWLMRGVLIRLDARSWTRYAAAALLISAPTFALQAIEYRVDVLSNLLLLAALLVITRAEGKPRAWVAAAALLALAVLASIRAAPVAAVIVFLAFSIDFDEQRWRFRRSRLWLLAGGLLIGFGFLAYLSVTGSTRKFVDDVIGYNVAADRFTAYQQEGIGAMLLIPVQEADVSSIAILVGGLAGIGYSLTGIRRPGLAQALAIVALTGIWTVCTMAVHYPYHLQTLYLILALLTAWTLTVLSTRLGEPALLSRVTFAIVIVGLSVHLVYELSPASRAKLNAQDQVMRTVDRITSPAESVLDGCGFALHRASPYQYWFIPAGLRVMASRGLIAPYDLSQLLANPPAAIVFTHRLYQWFLTFPRLGRHVVTHYLPLYRNLWIPALSGVLDGEQRRATWVVPRDGLYRVYVSEALAHHPWFRDPLKSGLYSSPDAEQMQIDFDRVPTGGAVLDWAGAQSTPSGEVSLRRGQVVSATWRSGQRVGVMVVPAGIRTMMILPTEAFDF